MQIKLSNQTDTAKPADEYQYAATEQEAITAYNNAVKTKIREHEAVIKSLYTDLIPTHDQTLDEEGYYKVTTPYRIDLTVNADEIFDLLKNDMTPINLDGMHVYEWATFIKHVTSGCLSDYDGHGDLLIDGLASSNNLLWLSVGMLYIYDQYLIPFERIPEVFKNHKIQVVWWNK